MPKKYCMWCETGSVNPNTINPMVSLHLDCFTEITSIASDIESVTKYLKGEMPRLNKAGRRLGYESVEAFLISMQDFDRRWKNSMKLIQDVRAKKQLEEKRE